MNVLIFSIILGFLAIIIPLFAVFSKGTDTLPGLRNYQYSIISFIFALFSILMQFMYQYNLAKVQDWSTIEDTIKTSMLSSTAVILAVILLNFAQIFKGIERSKEIKKLREEQNREDEANV